MSLKGGYPIFFILSMKFIGPVGHTLYAGKIVETGRSDLKRVKKRKIASVNDTLDNRKRKK